VLAEVLGDRHVFLRMDCIAATPSSSSNIEGRIDVVREAQVAKELG